MDTESRPELLEIPAYHRYLSYVDEKAASCKALHTGAFTFKLYASPQPGDFPFSPMNKHLHPNRIKAESIK